MTPATGQWTTRDAYPDPYRITFTSDGSRLSGEGCLGDRELMACSPLVVAADRGRQVDFFWDMTKAEWAMRVGVAYAVKMRLILAPDRTTLAGKVWTSLANSSDDAGHDVVLVRSPDQPLPPATACSDAEP